MAKAIKIKVICPANAATGGPEVLHQFCHELREIGADAEMLYMGYDAGKYESPVHPNYVHYQNPYSTEFLDGEDVAFVIPESMTRFMLKIQKGKKLFWWLSVDNYTNCFYTVRGRRVNGCFERRVVKFLKEICHRAVDVTRSDIDLHLTQSVYAWHFCEQLGIPEEKILYLSDYLNASYLKDAASYFGKTKRDQVLYNPKKGIEFTRSLMCKAPDITWIPLENMSYQQVAETMQESKVYIDFGNHPGKDRLPREAAINGCCIITGKRGSAFYHEDVPIPEMFKFDDRVENIPAILSRIKECFLRYEELSEDFAAYREIIRGEPEKFREDTEAVYRRTLALWEE